MTNRQLCLVSRPAGLPRPSNWSVSSEPVPLPGRGEFLVEVTHVSVDPAMRGWMNDVRSYLPPVGLGDVMRGPDRRL
jgi:NADPH-dependent curcumin reductase CurA